MLLKMVDSFQNMISNVVEMWRLFWGKGVSEEVIIYFLNIKVSVGQGDKL